jgi:uncharacterized damage-inducible protein DinB
MNHNALIDSFASAPDRLEQALRNLPEEMWDYRPSPDAWSVREIVIHMPDSEASAFVRCRKIIAQSGSTVEVYDQDDWCRNLDYQHRSIENALALFRAMRVSTVEVLRSVEESAWENYVYHPEDGKVTLRRWLEMYDRHAGKHIEQMRRNLDDWTKAGRPTGSKS